MKKLLLSLMMILWPMMAMADAVEIDGIYYNLVTKAKQAEVTQNPNIYSGSITIPDKVSYGGEEYDVTSIGGSAFFACTDLTSITIPNSVKSIENNAFYGCTSLTSVSIPNSVTSIGVQAFMVCSSLTSVTIGNSVTSIGIRAFQDCSGLTSITIPNSVTSIGEKAFSGCSGLTSVTIGNSVTSIGTRAFQGCSGLTSITIPNSVTSIGNYAFYGCSGLTTITIPNSVTRIEDYAFYGCSGLTTITIGSGTQTISSYAFAKCTELTDVYCYAENVPSTETNAFEGSYIDYAKLHVPDASINAYSQVEPWKNFKEIVGLSGTTPETQKCATPTIQIVDGKLKLSCETEGVTFVTSYTSDGFSDSVLDDEIVLAGTTTCHVSVYATKEGYENSDVAEADVELYVGKKGDVNADGEVNVGDIVTTTNIMAGKDE